MVKIGKRKMPEEVIMRNLGNGRKGKTRVHRPLQSKKNRHLINETASCIMHPNRIFSVMPNKPFYPSFFA
jgi:hypothetical protein